MNAEEWNRKYAGSIAFAERKIPEVKGVIAAYNSNLDAIVRVKPDDFERILADDAGLRKSLTTKLGRLEREISSKEDLLLGLLGSMRSGTGEERIIKNEDVFVWLESTFTFDQLRMGGQAGNIANTLAKLDVPNVIAHTASLPKAQASLFSKNVKIPAKRNGQIVLESPMDAVRPDDAKMVHYVFEFDKGTSIQTDDEHVESPRANRFVATWDPKNTGLEIDHSFLGLDTRNKADRAVLSGFHLLKRDYEDGSTHVDKLAQVISQVRRWKKRNPDLFIHLELGDNKYEEIYASTLKLLSPFVDSIGLNETEIMKAASSLELRTMKGQEPFSSATALETAKSISDTVSIPIMLVHTSDFSLCTMTKRRGISARSVMRFQHAILFGAALAAARAITARYNGLETVKGEVNKPSLSISPKGIQEHENLADFLKESYGIPREGFLSTGRIGLQDRHVIYAVSKVTEEPATTAGLGDSLISGYILGVT